MQDIQEILKNGVINLFEENWHDFYHILLTQYGMSSSEADEELNLILTKLKSIN